MYSDFQALETIVPIRHKEYLAEAEMRRLARQIDNANAGTPGWWQPLTWRMGEILIAFGRKLHAMPDAQTSITSLKKAHLDQKGFVM